MDAGATLPELVINSVVSEETHLRELNRKLEWEIAERGQTGRTLSEHEVQRMIKLTQWRIQNGNIENPDRR